MKTCSRCKRRLDLACFYRKKNREKDGLNPKCRDCCRELARTWAANNRERDAARSRAWYHANKERGLESRRAYYESHRDAIQERSRAWFSANKSRADHRERVVVWAKTLRNAAANNSRKRGHAVSITTDQILELFAKQNGRCFWTGVPMVPSSMPRDPQRPSLDRLDNERGYEPGNVVLACQFANIGRQTCSSERMGEFIETLREAFAGCDRV